MSANKIKSKKHSKETFNLKDADFKPDGQHIWSNDKADDKWQRLAYQLWRYVTQSITHLAQNGGGAGQMRWGETTIGGQRTPITVAVVVGDETIRRYEAWVASLPSDGWTASYEFELESVQQGRGTDDDKKPEQIN